jgi:hypothetical protein
MANFFALATFICTIGLMTWEFTFPVIDKVRNPYSALKTDMKLRTSLLPIYPLMGDLIPTYWGTKSESESPTPNINGKNLYGEPKTPSNSFNYYKGLSQKF